MEHMTNHISNSVRVTNKRTYKIYPSLKIRGKHVENPTKTRAMSTSC